MGTPTTTAEETPQQATAATTEATISGVKFTTTAKGYIQPEITVRYANASEALEHAVSDAFALFDRIATEAADRGLHLVTELA